jgi:hypothetical protein
MVEPVSVIERLCFGFDARRHPITNRMLEQGSGSFPEKEQAELHCRDLDRAEGKEAGDIMRRRLAIYYGADPPLPLHLVKEPAPEVRPT